MSELAAVLEKRRRKSEVKGAIVENVPGVTIADAIHTTNNDKKQVVDNDDDNGNEHDDNNNSGAGNELQKILRRRRRKSETASSVIVKEGKISDADAIHTHHEYNKSDSTEVNINMVEAHLRSLETKAEKGRKDLLKVETEISKNERRLSQMSINNDDYEEEEEENDNTTGETLETSSSIEVGKDENIAPSPTALESNATAKVDNEEILESPTLTTTSNDNEATEDDNRPSIEENQKEDATDNKEEQSELDTHDDGNNDNNNDDNNKEEEEQVEEEEEQVEEEGQPKEDPHKGKIEAKPGFWVTDNELAQLRIFLPGFKKVANERLYKVLPNLMAKTSKNVNTKKSNLDNRPRWKN